MAVTIREIAARAGVSRGTVDRVLHSRPGVRPEIAAHVRAIADELGFTPNRAGKMLASRKQPVRIGCLLPSIGNPFFDDVKQGIAAAERELADFGLTLLLREVRGYDARVHTAALDALVEQGCAALCASTVDTPDMRAYIDGLVAAGIPVVALNTDLSTRSRLCYVGNNYHRGGATAAGLFQLMNAAPCRLLIVTGSLHMKGHNERIRGFSRTLRARDIPYKLVEIAECQDNDDHAYQVTARALRAAPDINCVYIVAAGVAGVCRAVVESERQREIRVISHDAIPSTRRLLREGVISFTICQDPEQQGYRAVQLLFDHLLFGRGEAPDDYLTDPVIKTRENIGD